MVVGARRTPRTRSIGRARGVGAREDELERERGIIGEAARASGLSARARGERRRARERRGDARGGVVCRRCLALERERWEVKDEDERETNARLCAFETSWRSGGVEGARRAREARGATARGV